MQEQKPDSLKIQPDKVNPPTLKAVDAPLARTGKSHQSLAIQQPEKALPSAIVETPEELKESTAIGFKGYVRLLRIFFSFLLFAARLLFNRRDWRFRKQTPAPAMLHAEGATLREKLLALGPTFIKIGQTIATRADLLPVEYIQELSELQDKVPPFPTVAARAIIEEELQAKIEAIFRTFGDAPIAAASLGQVYQAVLQTGQVVAVKVQRPNIAAQIDFDLRVLRRLVRRLERYPNLIRGLDWHGTLDEFRTTISAEMDYAQEIRNAETFRKNFSDWREVYVPRIFPIFSTRRLIVMEFIEGVKVTDIEPLKKAGRNPHEVVKLLARTYLKQLLEDGFFHADPHPGNLRVMADGRLAFFDFGMVGRLSMELQSQLISAFFHIVERDVEGLVEDMIRLGFIELKKEDETKFKPIIQSLFDRYLSLKLKEVNFKELTFDLAKVIYEFPFRIPANFTYIVRAIMTLEGIGTTVDPNFNFFEVARPYAKGFMFKREGRYLRELIIKQLRGEQGDIEWGKVWKLAKMAFKYYWRGENKL
ncbi:MAG: AarF/ABC1/UbiB kinase family protein [Acidobacteria bacterium]|nr:AarF/ABC1/UbiB kinase family protein [Acidobacteriota bacterium]